MIAKHSIIVSIVFALFDTNSNSQEYVSRKVSYQPDDHHGHLIIGVGNESQWSLVSRLTGEVGDTLALESVQEGAYFDDASEGAYQRLNERALQLRWAKVIFVAPHAGCITAKLWYERLANQGVRVIELRPISSLHGRRAAQSLARQIYLGLIFASTDRQCIDDNFCKAVKELWPNDPVTQASPVTLFSPVPELSPVPPSP